MAPNSEAPAEMHFFIPRYKLLNLAENCTHNFHNLLPFRGADVRDALAWSKYLGEALQMWGGKADAMCGQHHWPVWGHERIDTMIRQQRDLYKFAHDQTIRLMNHGLTATEIAETIRLPKSLDGAWHGARLLRSYQAQCEGDLPEISRLVRRQSRQSRSAAAGRVRQEVCRIYGRRRRDPRSRAEGFCQGRIPLRGAGGEPSGIRRAGQSGGARDARRHLRAARLRRRKFDLAQRLSVRRAGAAAGHAEGAAALADAARNAGGAAHRATMGRARRPPQRPQGRRQAHRAELEFYRYRREFCSQPGELRADLCRGRASRRCRRRLHAGARHARRGHRQADDVPGCGRQRQDQVSPAIRCGSAN